MSEDRPVVEPANEIGNEIERLFALALGCDRSERAAILVDAEGTPKLLDFGIAKLLDPERAGIRAEPTATAARLMTPHYASPEQVQGKPVSTATDVYSLGVISAPIASMPRFTRPRRAAA